MSVDWNVIAGSVIVATPATVAAVSALRNGKQLKTPNGQTVGSMVQDAHDAATGANGAAQTANAIVRRKFGDRETDVSLREASPGYKRASDHEQRRKK